MTRSTCFLIVVLSTLGCGLAAADAVPPYTDPALEFEFAWNHERVAVDARAAKPSSVWWDPAAAKTVAHIQKQLDLLAQLSPRAWPVAEWLKTARGMAFMVYPPLDATGPEPLALTMVTTAMPFDPTQVLPDAPPVTLGAFAGHGDMNRTVAAVLGPVAALGSGVALARVQESGAKRTIDGASAPITLRLDLAAVLGWIKRLETDGITYGLDPLLPGWRDLAPVVTWSVRSDGGDGGGDWRGDGAITGITQSPLHPLAADMGALMIGGAQIRLAIGAEPRAIAGMLFNTMERAELEDFTALTGLRPDALMELFTGDALLLANLKGPLPLGALAVKLRDHADPAPLVAALAQKYRGETLPLEQLSASAPGTKGGYVLNLPPGPVAVVWNAQRLVIASDQPMGLRLLAGTPGDAPVPAGASVFAELDLPAIAPNWLPLLYAGYANLKKPLAVDPLIGLRSVLPEMALALQQHGDKKLSALLKFSDELVYHRGDAATRFTPGTLGETATWISACFPGTDPAIGIDSAFTIYGLSDPTAGTQSLYHQADGFHMLEDERQGHSVALTPAEVTKRIKNAKRLFGPDFSTLTMLPKRELPVLDRRWFIDQATLTKHLPRYRLLVRGTTDGAQAEEHGVPLAAIATAIGAYVLCTVEQPAMVRYHLGRVAAPVPATTAPAGDTPLPIPTPPGVVEF